MLTGLLALLACQALGEGLVRVLGLSFPGPIVGLVLLLAWLVWRRPPPEAPVVQASDQFLHHLGLLFVPAGVGVMRYGDLLARQWLVVVLGLVGSWLVALLVSAGTMGLVIRLERRWGTGPHWSEDHGSHAR